MNTNSLLDDNKKRKTLYIKNEKVNEEDGMREKVTKRIKNDRKKQLM